MSNLHVFNIARLAVRSLLTEAAVYPKPGLVTPRREIGRASCRERV